MKPIVRVVFVFLYLVLQARKTLCHNWPLVTDQVTRRDIHEGNKEEQIITLPYQTYKPLIKDDSRRLSTSKGLNFNGLNSKVESMFNDQVHASLKNAPAIQETNFKSRSKRSTSRLEQLLKLYYLNAARYDSYIKDVIPEDKSAELALLVSNPLQSHSGVFLSLNHLKQQANYPGSNNLQVPSLYQFYGDGAEKSSKLQTKEFRPSNEYYDGDNNRIDDMEIIKRAYRGSMLHLLSGKGFGGGGFVVNANPNVPQFSSMPHKMGYQTFTFNGDMGR